jgi:hypothetical protein
MQNGVLSPPGGAFLWFGWLFFWPLMVGVVVLIIRFAMRPNNERLDPLIRMLELRRDRAD